MVDTVKKTPVTGRRNRIAIVMPYFGRLPACLGTYLASLVGKHFDVLWISDLPVAEHPDNFKVVPMTFDACKTRIAERLGVPICITSGHRLCDFKPMYGHIFEDLLEGYDYWGFGDCDLVYGEAFNGFLDKTVLSGGGYDVVSLQREFLSGPTCLIRNDERMRTLYRKARNWKEICAYGESYICYFDECGGSFHAQLKAGTMTMEGCSRVRDSFAAVVFREIGLRVFRENVIDECWLNNGEVVRMRGEELTRDGVPQVAYHWDMAKGRRFFRVPAVPFGRIRDYRIEATGFYHGEWAWRTRAFRRVFRRALALVAAVRANGPLYLFGRVGKAIAR